ncbi:MAG: replication restart helicase PriA, partial [Candidatus Saccharimonadales bacterium]
NKPIVRLSGLARPGDHAAVEIEVVDNKNRGLFTRSSLLSQPLLASVEASLARGEQSLLYLNRRGTARLVICENCGWQAICPHCDIPLAYHGDSHLLRCHACNYSSKVPTSCPVCGYTNVVYKAAGTKAVVQEIKRLMPNARVARFDTDNLKEERFEQNYESAKEGMIDILVGTQMLAKGLDLPKLSTVGIVLADTSLYLPDFSASERTFQLINQVLGRIGRGHIGGRAVIQTYTPDNPILKAAIASDYGTFYQAELASRQQFMFSPFCYLLKVTVRRASMDAARSAALNLREQITDSRIKARIEGPAPSFYEKLQNRYQWQLIFKASQRSELLKVIKELPSGFSYDIDPVDLL